MPPFVSLLTVENYGCVQKLRLPLTRLHALVGPNDSGKSTLLRALRTVAQLAGGKFLSSLLTNSGSAWLPFDPMLPVPSLPPTRLRIAIGIGQAQPSLAYEIIAMDRWHEGIYSPVESEPVGNETSWTPIVEGDRTWESHGRLPGSPAVAAMGEAPTTPLFFRLEPTALREPSAQLVAEEPIRFKEDRGLGLPGVLQAIQSRDVDAFVELRNAAQKLFPNLKNIRVPTLSGSRVKLQAELSGKTVDASAISDGLLYFLAFAAMRHVEPTRLILIEEPENGLHPARIAEIMRVLRELSTATRIVLATHSPLVVNELQADEVTIITRDAERGTQARLLKETVNYAERSKVMSNGELWLAYSNGEDERGLLKPPERAA
jgi:energy-coupling factor transporter ATP-binding protein EcfA2